MIRIVFFGTPQIAADILACCMQDKDIEVVAVVAQPDTVGGRGHKVIEPATKILAREHGIPCHQPKKLRGNDQLHGDLTVYSADYFLVCAYGKIFPQEILDIPSGGSLNVHFSLLPEYRGAAPIQWPLLEGKKTTGITIQKMALEMDAGDIIHTLDVDIDQFETAGTLFEKCGKLAGPQSVSAMKKLHRGELKPQPQDHTQATFTRKIEKKDGELVDFSRAEVSFYKWKGYTPWPGLYFFLEGKRIRIDQCTYIHTDIHIQSGQVVELVHYQAITLPEGISLPKKLFGLSHDDGVLVLLAIQPEGRRSIEGHVFFGNHSDMPKLKIN